MCISAEQYRHVIGTNSANICRGRSISTGINYYTLNLLQTIICLLKLSNKQADRNTDGTTRQQINIILVMLLHIWLTLTIITLSMVFDISKSSAFCQTPCLNYSIRMGETNNVRLLPISLLHVLNNWSVILIFSKHFYRFFKTYKNLYYLISSKYPRNIRISFIDTLSKIYVLFITLLNLILIVVVTPSIVNPGPIAPTLKSPSELKVAYCNMQGIIMMSSMRGTQPIFQTNKLLDFQNYLHMNEPDIVLINETWLNEHVHSNEIVNENFYKIFRLDRSKQDKEKYHKVGGGGVLILVKQGVNIETKLVSVTCSLPILSIEIRFHDFSKICLSTFYRYGYSDHTTFELAEAYYRELFTKYNKIIIIGDLNLCSVKDWDNPQSPSSLESSYIDLFNDLGFKCLINSSTHKDGNILDLVLTNQPGLIRNIDIEEDLICPSDHSSITFKIFKNVTRKKITKRKIFNYKEADWDGLSHEIRSYDWYSIFRNRSIAEAWILFKSKLDISMRKFIPMKNVKFRNQPPWFDTEVFHMSKIKDKLRKISKKTNSPDDRKFFLQCKARFKQMVIEKKRDFITADPCNTPDNSMVNKKFWSFVKSNTKCGRIPDVVHYKGRYRSDKTDQCESFNNFFSDQFSESSDYDIKIDFTSRSAPDTSWLTSSIIFNHLRKVKPSKAPGPDGISGQILKNCASALSFPLSLLFNISYHHGSLPEDWRSAHIVPIHKKGKKDDIENYRPVSLTSLVMKIFEKCVHTEIFEICKSHITPTQHGFLPERSCVTQMIDYTNILTLNLNLKSQTDVIYFDFSKAFDSVNHDIILDKLKNKFGINGHLLKFILNYLKDRKQRVVLDGKFSSFSSVQSGVPQGSILGPLLFVLFINDIIHVVDKNSKILLYADDMKVFREILTQDDQYILQADIDALVKWSIQNKMKFHPNKCKVLKCSLKKRNSNLFVYNMLGSALQVTDSEKDLGVIVSSNMKFNKHHSAILCKGSQKLGLLRRTCSFSNSLSHRKTLYLAIVRSQFEHCSPIWRPVKTSQTEKFEALQKRGVKWIFGEDFAYYSKAEYFKKLKFLDILPLVLKFDLNDLVLFHKMVYGLTETLKIPDYLVRNEDSDDRDMDRNFRRQTRSMTSSDRLQYKCKVFPRIDVFIESFFHRTYLKWNKLSLDLREIRSSNCFKKALKQQLWIIAETNYCSN